MFKAGDIVFVSNPDKEYEEQMGARNHNAFFGRVTDVDVYGNETVVEVAFPRTINGEPVEWSYNAEELSYASELKNLTLEEFSNRYGLCVNGKYIIHHHSWMPQIIKRPHIPSDAVVVEVKAM